MNTLQQFETETFPNCTVIVTRNIYTGEEKISWYNNEQNCIDVEWEEIEDDGEE